MSETDPKTEETWLGTSLPDIHRGAGPWSFALPPIAPSRHHRVLFALPAPLSRPPAPHLAQRADCVRLPCDDAHWAAVGAALARPIGSVGELEGAIGAYNPRLPALTALRRLFDAVLGEAEVRAFFGELLPGIVALCLSLPELVPGGVPVLRRERCGAVSLSQLQVASLMANAFLCTFDYRGGDADTLLPCINFVRLFSSNQRVKRQNCVSEKIRCILHYFKRVIAKNPTGVLTFERKHIPRREMPRWDSFNSNLGNTRIHVDSGGTIEAADGLLQVDFANKNIGGGVLGYGCVQEEIRFIICPELIISRLFVEQMADTEAVTIYGAERFCDYTGYSDDFKFAGDFIDETPFDEFGRRRTAITAIDATRFNRAKDQYHCSVILRELNKAYVGFWSQEKSNLAAVATGNWGCGAFKGDANLKSLIQLMACNATNRDFVYYSFGDVELRDRFYNIHLFLANNQVTIVQLWRYLSRFCASSLPADQLYPFVQQCHFDMKSQPTLKQFLTADTAAQQKRKPVNLTASPSTSSSVLQSPIKESAFQVKKSKPLMAESDLSTASSPSNKRSELKFKALPIKIDSSNVKRPNINSDEIFGLIDMMDGKQASYGDGQTDDQTLLSQIDKLKDETIRKREEVVISIEVDTTESKPLTFIDDKKKKITDYFCKMNTKRNV